MSGLREALAAKKVRTEHYPILLVESDVVRPLAEKLQQMRNVAFGASLGDDQKAKDDAAAKVKEAQAALDACFWDVAFQGLRSQGDFSALVNAHPPTDEQVAEAKRDGADEAAIEKMMDMDGFHVALLMACIVDGDGMTAEEWRAELWSAKWTNADREALFMRVEMANQLPASQLIPNG